jgi:hypothetical protein
MFRCEFLFGETSYYWQQIAPSYDANLVKGQTALQYVSIGICQQGVLRGPLLMIHATGPCSVVASHSSCEPSIILYLFNAAGPVIGKKGCLRYRWQVRSWNHRVH